MSGLCEHHVGGGEQLPRLVVQRLRNPLRLALEGVVQAAKRCLGLDAIHCGAHTGDIGADIQSGPINS